MKQAVAARGKTPASRATGGAGGVHLDHRVLGFARQHLAIGKWGVALHDENQDIPCWRHRIHGVQTRSGCTRRNRLAGARLAMPSDPELIPAHYLLLTAAYSQ